MKSMTSYLRKFFKSRRGVLATEFALVAPVMVILWVGLVELATAYLVAQKVEMAAQSAADIIAQDRFVDNTKLANIDKAIKTIIYPYNTAKMGYHIASIVADAGGINSVAWHQGGGALVVPVQQATIADPLTTADDSVIAVTVQYNHTPIFFDWTYVRELFGGRTTVTIDETVFARPRLVPIVPKN